MGTIIILIFNFSGSKMSSPDNYKTLKGLVNKAERVLSSTGKVGCMSQAMWINNALYTAETKFKDREAIVKVIQKFTITRPQDLIGGHSCFGVELPKRDYIEGDVIPSVGKIDEIYGDQYFIGGQWYNKRCFDEAA
jgi:hypothetical protein